MGNFLSHEEVGGIDGIKTPYNHVKTEISASKSMFHSFHAVLWSMDHTKNDSQMNLSQVSNDKNSLLVTFSTIFFLPFHLAIVRKFRLDRKYILHKMHHCYNL